MENNLNELFATHPMMIRRINQLRSYAKAAQYQRLQGLINQNA